MTRFYSAALALLVSSSASAQAPPPDAAKPIDAASELRALNQKIDALTAAMKGPSRLPRVDDGAAFATPFPVACDGNCSAMAFNYCDGMGYARGLVPETPPIQGAPPRAYAYFICYGRK